MAFLRRGFLKSAHRPNNLYCYIDPLPYVGFALILLCAFMTAEPLVTHGVSVDLAKTKHAQPIPYETREDAMLVVLVRDGTIFFRNNKTLVDELPDAIRHATLNGSEKKIYLLVDARAHYGDLSALLAQIQGAGIENICFVTENPFHHFFQISR